MTTHNSQYPVSLDDLEATTEHALESLLWSETYYATGDDFKAGNGVPFDDIFGVSDVEGSSRLALRAELEAFINDDENSIDLDGMEYSYIGHDFILTRNGHGTGFWDRGLGERGERLTAACKPYGAIYAYSNDGETVGLE
jgi:hypothetical protein